MTRLEKAKELHPEMTVDKIVGYCPEEQLPIDTVACPFIESENSDREVSLCQFCWNKEFKEG